MEKFKAVIIHHNDLDGVGAAAIVYNALTDMYGDNLDVEFVAYCYNEASNVRANEALRKASDEEKMVYIVDISISEANIDKISNIYEISPDRLVWCDHHASSVSWLKNIAGTAKSLGYNGIVNPRRSGACHAYQFMHGCAFRNTPEFVKLIDDYDRYQLKCEDSVYFNTAFFAVDEMRDPASVIWQDLCHPDPNSTDILNLLIAKGCTIHDYLESTYRVARRTRMIAAPVIIRSEDPKHEVLVYNSLCINHAGDPAIFGDQTSRDDIDICISWYKTNTDAIKYSFRTTHNWVRCDILAKYLGGGGHKLAAGANLAMPIRGSETPGRPKCVPPCRECALDITVSPEDYKILRTALRKKPPIK